MLNRDYKRALKICEPELINDLIVKDVFPQLLSTKYFTYKDIEFIESVKGDEERVSKLLDIIRDRPDELFEKFKDILRETNKEIAELLERTINQREPLKRRPYSKKELGEMLINGEVPHCCDYISRQECENRIFNCLKLSEQKPILVYGISGCGKSSIVAKVLRSCELFPNHFLKCCWLNVGNVNETSIVNTLTILLKKLNPKKNFKNYCCPEVLVQDIKQELNDTTTLLILDDIWNLDIMKYFEFLNASYIVTSRQINLFSNKNSVHIIEIPNKLNESECQKIMKYYHIPQDIAPNIIKESSQNPMLLSIICKKINFNSDYIRLIDKLDFSDLLSRKKSDKISRPVSKKLKNKDSNRNNVKFSQQLSVKMDNYLHILDIDTKNCYKMLAILQTDDILSVELLSVLWNLSITKALEIVDILCETNFLYNKLISEHNFNMYGVHDIHLKHLINQHNKKEREKLMNLFISYHEKKYENWLEIDYHDPFFIKFYGRTLYYWKKYSDLENLYTNFSFLSAKIAICGITELLIDFHKYNLPDKTEKWLDFEKYFLKHHHKLLKLPENKDMILKIRKVFALLVQLGLYELKDCSIYGLANESRKLCKRNDFWNWINPQHSMKVWEVSNIEDIELFDINQYGILSSSKSGKVCIYEFKSGKCLLTYQFSEANIILLKFIDRLKFIVIDSHGKFWTIDLLKFLQKENKNVHHDDNDFIRTSNKETDEIVFLEIVSKFDKLTINHNISKSEIKKLNNYEDKLFNSNSLRVCSCLNEIAILNIGEKFTYVAIFDLNGRLVEDLIVDFEIKKILYTEDEMNFYTLNAHTGEIIFIDKYGNKDRSYSLPDQIIIDFFVKFDLLAVLKNSIYNFSDSQYVLTIDNDAEIRKISMSDDSSLLALYLTDCTVEVLNYKSKEVLYKLHDTQFFDLYFTNDPYSIITIGQTNIAKWEISSLKLSNNNISEDQRYRKHFTMYDYSPSSFVLVLQSTKNNLEFISITNNNIDDNVKMTVVHVCPENRPVAVFHSDNNFAFLGYMDGTVKIFDLINFKEVLELKTSVNIKKLFTFEIEKSDIIGLVVVFKSTNEIVIFHLRLKNDVSYEQVIPHLQFQQEINNWFMFNINRFTWILATVIYDTKCLLYNFNNENFTENIFGNLFWLKEKILDMDVSEKDIFFSCIGVNRKIQIWKRPSCELHCLQLPENVLKCKFRPTICINNWNLLAVLDEKAEIHLIYFNEDTYQLNKIIEDLPAAVMQKPNILQWSSNSDYLLIADYDIRKWKIPKEPSEESEQKLSLTKLYTHFGGIHCVEMNLNYICTVDQQGYLYILKKVD